MVTTDTLFTVPKPLVHLFYHLVDIVLEGGVGRGGQAYRDLMSVLSSLRS